MCFIAVDEGKDDDLIDMSNVVCCMIVEDILSPEDLTLLPVAGSDEKEIKKTEIVDVQVTGP